MLANFVAVQCFQCSTMQVKQRRKSGNKWTCVVCNNKQSIRKVFAQGTMAKGLRKFVQSFNMSRNFLDEHTQAPTSPLDVDILVQKESPVRPINKRCTDWTEYLDLEDDCDLNRKDEQKGVTESDFEGKIVTEWPEELFKKPKLKSYHSSRSESSSQGNELIKPIFSKRKNAISHTRSLEGKRACNLTKEEEGRSMNGEERDGGASKWSKYITHHEDDWQMQSKKGNFGGQQIGDDLFVTMTNYETVEDEVHPSFSIFVIVYPEHRAAAEQLQILLRKEFYSTRASLLGMNYCT